MRNKFIKTLLILLTFAFFSAPVFGQEKDLILLVTPYKTRRQLNFMFAHSSKVLAYFEGEDLKEPVFVSLVDDIQLQKIIEHGLSPKVIDYKTNLARYVMLFHFQPNQSAKLTKLGEVFPITKFHTLLKLIPNTEFDHQGVAAEFHYIPFPETIVSPPIPTSMLSPSPIILTPTIEKLPISLKYLLTLVSFLLSSLSIFIILKKKPQINKLVALAIFLVLGCLIFLGTIFLLEIKISDRSKNDLEIRRVEQF